jgi:hypothetical protein
MSSCLAPLPSVRKDRFGAFSHVVASRQGLFLVNETRYEPLAEGAYFGLSLSRGALYAFERGTSGDDQRERGRVLRLQLSNDRCSVVDVTQAIGDLDIGCHQIDFIGNRLHVVDTHRQQLLVCDPVFLHCECLSPLPIRGSRETNDPGYVHMNSIVARGRNLWIMLHNNGRMLSEILRIDERMEVLERVRLAYRGCHDIVPLEDGDLLYCGSDAGVIATTGGLRVPVIPSLMTRGLSVTTSRVVVGSSVFGPRLQRPGLPGVVSFLTRDYRTLAHVAVPGSPTDIVSLHGEDLSLSA